MIARMAVRDAPGRGFHLVSAALLGGALAAAPRAARADEARPLILLVVPAGDAARGGERAAATIAAHLRPLRADLAMTSSGSSGSLGAPEIAARSRQLVAERHACGVLWVDLGRAAAPGALSLFLYARDGARLFERRVPAEKEPTAATFEALALIAQSASAELLEGKVAAMTAVALAEPREPAAAPPAAAPVTPRGPRSAPEAGSGITSEMTSEVTSESTSSSPPDDSPAARARRGGGNSAALAAGYVGNTAGRTLLWQSAFAMEAGWHPTPRATLGLGYEFALPDSAAGAPSAAQAHRHPLFAATGYRVLFLPRWDLELGARGVVDFITTSGGRAFSATTSEVRSSLGPTADLGLRLVPPLRLGLRLGADVMLDAPSSMGSWSASDQIRFAGGLGLQLDLDTAGAGARPRAQNTASR